MVSEFNIESRGEGLDQECWYLLELILSLLKNNWALGELEGMDEVLVDCVIEFRGHNAGNLRLMHLFSNGATKGYVLVIQRFYNLMF